MLKCVPAAFVFAAMLIGAAIAGRLEDGLTAYQRGDYSTAIRLLQPFAEEGNLRAQIRLGAMYYDGIGVPRDRVEAFKWYQLAAAKGSVEAQYTLGDLYSKGRGVQTDVVLAHMWFSLAVAQGHPDASHLISFVKTRMSADQIAEAERLAREWKPKPER